MIHKKAQGLPLNIVVSLIIGIIIFGLGIAMFAKISNSGDEQIENLNSKIKTNIQSLECDGEQWICAPNYKINIGDTQTFRIFVANRGDETDDYKAVIGDGTSQKIELQNDDCGEVDLFYPNDLVLNIESGTSASIPFVFKANQVLETPCSFVKSVKLEKVGEPNFEKKTPIIVRVE